MPFVHFSLKSPQNAELFLSWVRAIECSIHFVFQHEDEKKTMARERLRDRTYSETFTSHRPPKCKPGRPRPRNGEQPSTNKVPISIDAATLPWLKRRSNFNDFSQPSKQKKTCQDTNTEGLKVCTSFLAIEKEFLTISTTFKSLKLYKFYKHDSKIKILAVRNRINLKRLLQNRPI